MVKPKIAMILDNEYKPDARVQKEAHSLALSGYEVTVFAWDKTGSYPSYEVQDGIRIVRIFIEIVHCHDLITLPAGVWLKLKYGKKLVYDAHEIYYIVVGHKYPKIFLNVIKYFELLLLYFTDRFYHVSEQRKAHYQHYYSRPIFVVGNWFNPSPQLAHVERKNIRKHLGIPSNVFCLTYLGFLAPRRNISLLIDYASKYKDTFVVIGGEGVSAEAVKQAALENSNLIFLGWVKNTKDVFSVSDAIFYVLSREHPYSRYNSPNTLYQAIAHAVPLVTNELGESGSVVAKERCGVILTTDTVEGLREAITKLNNPDFYGELKQNLIRLQTKYSWKSAEAQLLKIYRSLELDQ